MINKVVKQCVMDGDVAVTRSTLARLAYMADKTSHTEFVDSLKYAEDSMPDLYVEDDKKTHSTKGASVEVYKEIAKSLMDNFSKEKCNVLLDFGNSLFADSKDNPIMSKDKGDEAPFFSRKPRNGKLIKCIVGMAVILILIVVIIKLLHR